MANDFSSNPWIIDTVEEVQPVTPVPAPEPVPVRRDARGRVVSGPTVQVAAPAPTPRQGPKPPMSMDLLRVNRIRYVGGTAGEEILIQDQHGKTVWEGRVRADGPLTDILNTPGGGNNWDGMNVVKLGTGKLYIELM